MMKRILVNEKAYRLSFCEDPFLCAIISDDSNDSVDTCPTQDKDAFSADLCSIPTVIFEEGFFDRSEKLYRIDATFYIFI